MEYWPCRGNTLGLVPVLGGGSGGGVREKMRRILPC